MSSTSEFVNDRRVPCDVVRRQRSFSDVTIKIGDRTFPCHRILLASKTKYFWNMFYEEYVEAERDEVVLKGVDADDFELLLRLIYGWPVSLHNGDDAYRLLRVSHYLHPEGLENLFTLYLAYIDSIPLNTVARIYEFACRFHESTFATSLAKCIAGNFPATDRSDDNPMLQLSGKELLMVFEQPDFSGTPVDTFNFLNRWAKFQSSETRESLLALLRSIRFQDIPEETLVKFVADNWVNSNAGPSSLEARGDESAKSEIESNLERNEESPSEDEILEAVVKIMTDNVGTSNAGPSSLEALGGDESEKSVIESNLKSNGEWPRPKNVIKLPFILYLRDHCVDSNTRQYNVNKYKAENLSHLLFLDSMYDDDGSVKDFKAVTVCGVQYMVVNDISDKAMNLIPFTYSGGTRTKWSSQSSRIVQRRSTSRVAASNTEIYAYLYTGDMYSYRCELDSWYCVQECFPVRVDKCNMLSYEQSLYLIGGVSRENPTNYEDEGKYFQRYDTRERKGVLSIPMKYSHIKPASCVYNDVLYVCGGEYLSSFTGPIECFDFKAGKWDDFKTSLPWPTYGQKMIPHDHKLWFFGGWNYGDAQTKWARKPNLTWFYYDMRLEKWSENTSLPTKIRNFSTVRVLDVVVEK